MDHSAHNKLVSFIWSIADDCLRDVYVRGKYRDVILPMVVLRRLDTLLEPSKKKVLEEASYQRNEIGLTELDDRPLQDAAGYVFYNSSKWTMKQLFETATNNQQILLANVEEYLNGFSANVLEIVEKFKLKSQVRHMASKDVLLDVLEKFTSPNINLTPFEGEDPDGNKLPALTNLGNKNCEFSPEHIREIADTYLQLSEKERGVDEGGIAAQVFKNSDFGYYKVNIERPDRRKAQFSTERIETLRFDKGLREPMQWIYSELGDSVYEADTLKEKQKEIIKWCEENDLSLNTKNRKKLLSLAIWEKHQNMVQLANMLMREIGEDEYSDFNQFKKLVDKTFKAQKLKPAPADKNAILNAVSWYCDTAEKVIKKKVKLNGDKLEELLQYLGCEKQELADFGYYQAVIGGDKVGEYIAYESNSDLRDSESVPLNDNIYRYFVAEVKPHVDEAWINLDSTKIGYEISFNKYFYKHKPLRNMEVVAQEILNLEAQTEGLIAEILGGN